jgi:hypothetical protein
LASGDEIALRRTVSGPRSESGPCDRSSVPQAFAGSGNAAIGSRAPIGRAWSCRNPFGRHASFDPNESCAAHCLHPRAATGGQASCGSSKARSERKDSPDRQRARGWDGRFARTKCCSAAGWDAQNITELALHFSSADGAVTRASRAGAAPLTSLMPPGIARPLAAMDRSGLASCVEDASKSYGLASYKGLECGNEPPLQRLNVARSSMSSAKGG